MKQSFILNQTLKQTLNLSYTMKNALTILKMNQGDLVSFINELVESNPAIDYSPSIDMHQYLNESIKNEVTLSDELYLQLHTCNKRYDKEIANYIIESLDEYGFLSYSLDEYCSQLHCTPQNFQKNLAIIQSFEPLGVAATDCIDSIKIQLQKQYLLDGEDIFINYQSEMIQKNYTEIAKKKQISIDEVMQYIDDIKSCDPYPCRNYQTFKNEIILPDFEIKVDNNEVTIIPKDVGHISINNQFEKYKYQDTKMKEYFKEAHYFIDSLTKRNKTLLIMANELIHIQKNHFLFHDELKACVLMDIANATSFHESTVSRTLSNKFFIFENEIYPVKSLFISMTKEGSSKDAIQNAIHKLTLEEDKSLPLADYEIVEQLKNLELYVSRRTVAKYRALLHIPNSKIRKE